MKTYFDALEARDDTGTHATNVLNAMAVFDGRVIVEGFYGQDFIQFVWNAGTEGVIVLSNGEEYAVGLYIDEYGRPAFEAGQESGWIDIVDGNLFVRVAIMEDTGWWAGPIPDPDNSYPLIDGPAKKCLCKGSNQGCPENDCTTGQPCTLPKGGGNSRCKWLDPVLDDPDPGPCGDGIVAVTVPLLVFALAIPIRRRIRTGKRN